MNKLLTLAIASYNMEDYLPRCLDSVISIQRLASVEIIIVNDGSTDRTSVLAHQYESSYPNSITVIEKNNGNYGSCINAALSAAKGRYFRPLDADDRMDSLALDQLLEQLESIDTDLIITGFSRVTESKTKIVSLPQDVKFGTNYAAADFDFVATRFEQIVSMHSMTYRTALLQSCQLKLHEGISYTDTEYSLLPLDKVKTLCLLPLTLYQYYQGRSDQSMHADVLRKNCQAFFVLSQSLLSYYIAHAAENNATVRSNQRCILRRVVYYFYLSVLVLGQVGDNEREMLSSVETLVCQDNDFRNETKHFTYKRIPFVYCWRRFRLPIARLLPFLR